MKRTELNKLPLHTKVKLTPQGKTYTIVMSNKSQWKPALEDENLKIKEVSEFTSVYYDKTSNE
jgi:hypothetical protein